MNPKTLTERCLTVIVLTFMQLERRFWVIVFGLANNGFHNTIIKDLFGHMGAGSV